MPDAPVAVTVKIDTSELEKLSVLQDVVPAFQDGLEAAANYGADWMAEYPPHTAGNLAGPYPKHWYVRGSGNYWALKGGGFHYRKTSERLDSRWTFRMAGDRMSATIGNNASYAVYVQSREKQAPYHAEHGWRTAEDFVEKQTDTVLEMINDFVAAAIDNRRKQRANG